MRRATNADHAKIRANLKELRINPHDSATPAYAFLNEGRWVATCDECNGAEFVTEGKEMVCGTCGEVSAVVWPDDVEAIERKVSGRRRVNQHWLVGETVEMLEAENLEHGVA